MTSSNVSNLLVQVGQIDISAVGEKMSVPKDKGLFESTLKNVAGSGNPVEIKRADTRPISKEEANTKTFDSTPAKVQAKVDAQDGSKQPPEATEIIEKVEAVAEEIKEVIVDELDISDEQLEAAMSTLGLTVLDLFNPQNLAQLVTELTGETDSVSLLTDDSFKIILDNVSELTNQLIDDLKISFEDVKELIIPDLQPKEFEIPMDEIDVQNPAADIINPEVPQMVEDFYQLEKPVEDIFHNQPQLQQMQTLQDKPIEPNAEKPLENIEPKDEARLEVRPDIENEDFDSSKQEFNFSKNEKTAQETLKIVHETTVRNDGVVFVQSNPIQELQFSVEQEVVNLPTGESVRAESIVNQLVEQAKVLTDSESTTMEMTLNPEGLGKIFMEVTQKGDQITAKIFTENDAVKQALENQMANLRLELNQNSTKITSIEVSVGAHEFERNLEQNARDDSRREEQMKDQSPKRSSRIHIDSLDELSGMMSEEDMLIAQIMRDNGNTLDFQA